MLKGVGVQEIFVKLPQFPSPPAVTCIVKSKGLHEFTTVISKQNDHTHVSPKSPQSSPASLFQKAGLPYCGIWFY